MEIKRHLNEQPQIIERDGKRYISGYAIRYYDGTPNTEYEMAPGIVERIKPGVFIPVLNSLVRATYNHNDDFYLGDTAQGNVILRSDDKGVCFDILFDEADPDHIKTAKRLASGVIKGCSFKAHGISRSTREGNTIVSTIEKINRFEEISLVHEPAYKSATAYIRNDKDRERAIMVAKAKLLLLS